MLQVFVPFAITAHHPCTHRLILRPCKSDFRIVAHSPAFSFSEATQTTEHSLPRSQSLKHLKMANPLAGWVASKRCRWPNGSSWAWLRSR